MSKYSWAWGESSLSRMDGVYIYLIECVTETLSESKYDLTIPWMGGKRTAKQQNEIFQAGHSQCDGYEKLSYHQPEATPENIYGMALDVRPVGWTRMGKTELNRAQNYIARLMLINWQELVFKYAQQGIDIGVMVWGGTFGSTGWDKPHFEVRI